MGLFTLKTKTIFTTMETVAQIVIRARARLLAIAGQDFTVIYSSLKKQYFYWALQKSEDLQIALLNYPGTCSIHFPSHK